MNYNDDDVARSPSDDTRVPTRASDVTDQISPAVDEPFYIGPENPYLPPVAPRPVWAEIVLRRRPRIWTAIVVGVGSIFASILVAASVLSYFMMIEGDPAIFNDSTKLNRWLEQFSLTRTGLLAMILPGQLVFLCAAFLAAGLSRHPTVERLGLVRGRIPWWTWPIFVCATPVIGFTTSLLLSLVFQDNMGGQMEMMNNMFGNHGGWFFLVVILLVSCLPGFVEETLFRGYVQKRLLEAWPPVAAIGLSTALFAAAHLDPIHVIAVAPLGAWLGIVAWRCGSVWPAIFCHMANNLLAVIGVRLERTPISRGVEIAGVTVSSFDLAITGVSMCAFLVAVMLLLKWPAKKSVKDGGQDAIEFVGS